MAQRPKQAQACRACENLERIKYKASGQARRSRPKRDPKCLPPLLPLHRPVALTRMRSGPGQLKPYHSATKLGGACLHIWAQPAAAPATATWLMMVMSRINCSQRARAPLRAFGTQGTPCAYAPGRPRSRHHLAMQPRIALLQMRQPLCAPVALAACVEPAAAQLYLAGRLQAPFSSHGLPPQCRVARMRPVSARPRALGASPRQRPSSCVHPLPCHSLSSAMTAPSP